MRSDCIFTLEQGNSETPHVAIRGITVSTDSDFRLTAYTANCILTKGTTRTVGRLPPPESTSSVYIETFRGIYAKGGLANDNNFVTIDLLWIGHCKYTLRCCL